MASPGAAFVSQSLYYKHSGKFSIVGMLKALVLGLLVGIPTAWVYAWVIYWNPLIILSCIACFVFALTMGYSTEGFLEKAKIRSSFIAGLTAFLVAATSYYVSWAVWLRAVLKLPVIPFVVNPFYMLGAISFLNSNGVWKFRGSAPTGAVLWFVWGAEAVFVIGFATYMAAHQMLESTFCEGCDQWTKKTEGICYAGAGAAPSINDKQAFKEYMKALKPNAQALKQRLEAKDFKALEELRPVHADAIAWYQLDLHQCPTCAMTNTLRLKLVQKKIEGKSVKQSTDEKEIFRQLSLTSSEADAIKSLGGKMSPELARLQKAAAKPAAAAGS